ncbi:MAG: hypothetical protein H6696_11140 [Deferribacteres bacterium]|nr:hypothetical protein [candidate division KSB1 bacterium]MCB9502487.1 hypothetical protein [Deferribacteres bacterium]
MRAFIGFYNVFIIPLLYLFFRISGLFNKKIARGINGRKDLLVNLERNFQNLPHAQTTFLIHAASMGEYEQARPVLRLLRKQFPDARIILSLFSPSAFENIKPNPDVHVITYLPFDSSHAVKKFLNIVRPDFLLITRHDIWPNLVWHAKQNGVKTFLIDASVHEGSLRHKPVVRNFNRLLFSCFDTICVISEPALEGLRKFLSPNQNIVITGDTRFDQVVARTKEIKAEDLLPASILKDAQIFIAGSTWPEDEDVVIPAFRAAQQKIPGLRLIFVPHELTAEHFNSALNLCKSLGLQSGKLSEFDQRNGTIDALLVDKMGILANLYGAGQAAYVGGSFGPGVHSVIEAAAHKIPVTFGPRMRNSAEAIEMVEHKCGFSISTVDELSSYLIEWFSSPETLENLSGKAAQFVAARSGASQRILELIVKTIS